MTSRLQGAAILAALSLLVIGCGSAVTPSPSTVTPSRPAASASGSASVIPIPITQLFRVGDNRIMFTLTDPSGQKQVAAPSRTLAIGYHGPNGETIPSAPQTFIWAIEGANGVYVGHATFPSAGQWTADFTTAAPGSPAETTTFGFDVHQTISLISPGDAAPSVDTPTLADVGGDLAKISSDTKPVKRFYETSEADALAAKRPFVLIFATPKFCVSTVCGPTLDKLKPVAAAHPDLTFINVEPYVLQFADGSLQPVMTGSDLTPAPATVAFGLVSEPVVYVVGSDGKVVASFEQVFSPDEIEAAIRQVAGPG
jgi:hypothetical protein